MSRLTSMRLLSQARRNPEAEPALKVGGAATLVATIISVIASFVPISDDVQTIIILLVAIFTPVVSAVITRKRVWSPATVIEVTEDAVKSAEEVLEDRRNENALRQKSESVQTDYQSNSAFDDDSV